jgi:hypothetical protein
MQCTLYKIYFWKVFHMNYNLICIFICTPICVNLSILVKSGCYMVAHVHPGWSLQESIFNMIQVTYQTRGLLVTPRYSLKLSVTPDIVSKPVNQILTPCCYKKIIHPPSCAIVQLIKIRPKTNLIPRAMLSMTYPETHPISIGYQGIIRKDKLTHDSIQMHATI